MSTGPHDDDWQAVDDDPQRAHPVNPAFTNPAPATTAPEEANIDGTSTATTPQDLYSAPRRKTVTYRVFVDTFLVLESLRISLGKDTNQAHAIEHLLALADAGRAAVEHLGVQPADIPGRLTELIGQLQVHRAHLDQQNDASAALYDQIGALQAKVTELQHQLQPRQAPPAPVSTASRLGNSAPCGSFRW